MKLIIANKTYSSWSMRPWLVLKAFDIPFSEVLIPFGATFDDPNWKAAIADYTPAGKVPALLDGKIKVWETLAMIEYIAELHPELPIWPKNTAARAMARAISSEMHAGFGAIRNSCPMNLGKKHESKERGSAVSADVARICAIWNEARTQFGAGGDFLFGEFSAADAMFAPLATRIVTYSIPVDTQSQAYVDTIYELPAFKEWQKSALNERWIVPLDEADEPVVENYRPHLVETKVSPT
jgi:glutathione S-transferase